MVIRDVAAAGREGTWLPEGVSAVARFGPLVLVVVVALVVLRAVLQHRRFVARSVLDEEARAAVRDALIAAEARTEGEIVPVVLERSDRHLEACWRAALAAALAGSALLVTWLPWQQPLLLLAFQVAAGVVGGLLARGLPGLQRLFIGERRATEVAQEQAVQEFHRAQLHRTRHGTGVLLFVSLLERRVIVLGDDGIHAKVGDDHWASTTQAVLQGIAAGSLRAGLIDGIGRCGVVLAEHFPRQSDDVNELPDRLVVRRE